MERDSSMTKHNWLWVVLLAYGAASVTAAVCMALTGNTANYYISLPHIVVEGLLCIILSKQMAQGK